MLSLDYLWFRTTRRHGNMASLNRAAFQSHVDGGDSDDRRDVLPALRLGQGQQAGPEQGGRHLRLHVSQHQPDRLSADTGMHVSSLHACRVATLSTRRQQEQGDSPSFSSAKLEGTELSVAAWPDCRSTS